ncbi:MAG: protein serine/threonine phosphatase [Bacteroidetes bacterium]|nr:MAG: protein serine/threonine phosphatase [Bacteroidota bacterium]
MNLSRLIFFLFLSVVNLHLHGQERVIDSLKKILPGTKDSLRIALLFRISDEYLDIDPPKAIPVALEARKIAEDLSNEMLTGQAIGRIGLANFNMGNYDPALKSFSEAKFIYEKLDKKSDLAEIYIQIAETKRSQGQFQDALQKVISAYNIYESIDDKKGMARALNNSGLIYYRLNNFSKAVSEYEHSMELRKQINDENGVAACLNNLANVYIAQKNYDKSIEYHKQALEIRKKSGNKGQIARALNNLGAVYFQKKEYETAMDYFFQSLELRKEIGDKRGMISSLANLGSVNMNQGRRDKAIEYFERALQLAREVGARDLESELYESFAEAYEQKGDHEKALEFYKLFASNKDSLFNADMSKNVAEMQARFDVQKAETENKLNQIENEKITGEKRLITIAAVIGVILLLVIVGFLWNRTIVRKRINTRLEKQKQEIEIKNSELQSAYVQIEEKNKDITDSIRYAKRLQEAILPEEEFAQTFGSSAFVLYRPKDIVSGDFYWMERISDDVLFAAVDCTGHGVPGAFVSIVCSNLLTQAVNEGGLLRPAEILDEVNIKLSQTLRQRSEESKVRDGMDIALCRLDLKKQVLEFAGAFNPLYLVRKGELIEYKSDKFPVGAYLDEDIRHFAHHEMKLEKGDVIYLFSDGYADQFGGPEGKKFKRSRFKELLLQVHREPMAAQRERLNTAFDNWRGRGVQVDDVLVMGVSIV